MKPATTARPNKAVRLRLSRCQARRHGPAGSAGASDIGDTSDAGDMDNKGDIDEAGEVAGDGKAVDSGGVVDMNRASSRVITAAAAD
jgi:hypothetical protein